MQNSRSKYHLFILAAVAILTVMLFAHGRLSLSGDPFGFTLHNRPRSSSVEVVQSTAASQMASGNGMALGGDIAQFPETIQAKKGIVPACSPVYLSLLSIASGWADKLTPSPDNIRVSSDLGAEKAEWERNYRNYARRYKLTVIFFQGPFLILMLLFFYAASARLLPDADKRFWLTLGLCFGTLAYPFALTLNPIFPAAALLLCGMHYVWSFAENRLAPDGLAAGLFIGVAVAFHHLCYIPAVAAIIILLLRLREPERLLPFIGGLLPGLAAFIFAHIAVFGDPFPAIYHRGGGDSGPGIVWQHFIWSIIGNNGALWMAPATAAAFIYALAGRFAGGTDMFLKKVIGIAALLLLIAASFESVYTYQPLYHPDTGATIEDAYAAEKAASPQIDIAIDGFPMSVAFHTKTFGGEALALIGPCLFLLFSGVFASGGAWHIAGFILIRVGILIGIFAAYNPLGTRFFPLAENIHQLGVDLALRFPREAIF